jgi:TRAP-type C4-dicarboxylate transport system substrate-binding protein
MTVEENGVNRSITRRLLLAGVAVLGVLGAAGQAMAEPIKLRFADSTTADAPRSVALVDIFAKELGPDFVFEPYFGSTLYKQGTEIVAVQRGNLEMALMPPSDFAKQDNPLPNDRLMKFHEVTDQIVLTSHNVGFGLLLINADLFDKLTPEQQKKMQDAAEAALAWSDAEYVKQEAELVEFFKGEGLDVYTPDVQAFREYSNKKYLESPLSKDWPAGMIDRINAL